MKREEPNVPGDDKGGFYTARDGCKLFIYNYQPSGQYKAVIFMIPGITGINHHHENDTIELLSNKENRVVVIHPRGTGFSDGVRGDISNFRDFIDDLSEIITHDRDYLSNKRRIFLFGHSMATAVLLAVSGHLSNIAGAILVNPPFVRKQAKGMSPGLGLYLKYAFYYLFSRHKPVVNMAGDPSAIENEEDRKDAEQKMHDPLLVRYFSLYYMLQVNRLLKRTLEYCRKSDFPLLLLYGMRDPLVDKAGCDLIYKNWKHRDKEYRLIENGSHGKSTVMLSMKIIHEWIHRL